MIIEFRIKGYLCFKDTGWIPLAKLAVFIGKNDGGKSSALRALLSFLTARSFEDADHRLTGDLDEHEEPIRENDLLLELKVRNGEQTDHYLASRTLGGQTHYQKMIPLVADEELNVVLESLTVAQLRGLAEARQIVLEKGALKGDIVRVISDHRNGLPTELGPRPALPNEIRSIATPLFYDEELAGDPRNAIQRVASDFYELNYKARVIEQVAPLRQEVQASLDTHMEQLALDLRAHCEEIESVRVPIKETAFSDIKFEAVEVSKADGRQIDWNRIGKGKKREMSLAIFRRQNKILEASLAARAENTGQPPILAMFDEPDVNLDYDAQRRVSLSLTKLAGHPDCQVISASHSHNVIESVPLQCLTFFGESVPDPDRRVWQFELSADESDLLALIRSSTGLSNSALFNEKLFVVCSGPTEVSALDVLFPHLTGRSMAVAGIRVLSGENDEQAYNLYRLLKANFKAAFLVVDKDAVSGPKAQKPFKGNDIARDRNLLQNRLAIGLAEFFDLGASEFEDEFADQVWVGVLNDLPVEEGQEDHRKVWVQGDVEAMRQTDKFSAALLNEANPNTSKRLSKPILGNLIAHKAIDLGSIPANVATLVQRMDELTRN